MTGSIVNRGVYNSGAVSGNSIAMGFTPTTGNWLVCIYFDDDFTAPSAGTGWTKYAGFNDGTSFISTGIYYQQVGASPSSTITPVTGSVPANGAAVYEFSGLPHGLPTDFVTQQMFANGGGSSPSFSAVSSTATSELIVFSATRLGTGQTIAGTTYDATHNTGTGNARDVADAYKVLAANTSVTPTISFSSSNNVGGGLVLINLTAPAETSTITTTLSGVRQTLTASKATTATVTTRLSGIGQGFSAAVAARQSPATPRNNRVRGLRVSVPQGFILGRASPGTGSVELIRLRDLVQKSKFDPLAPGTLAGVAQPSNANPLMDGTATPGTSLLYAREGHVHPTDTSRAPLASPAFTGTPTSTTNANPLDASAQVATDAFVNAAILAILNSVVTLRIQEDSTQRITEDGLYYRAQEN